MTVPPEISALLDKADMKLNAAAALFKDGLYDDSVSRAYYAAFHAMTAALLKSGQSYSSHTQLIGAFNKDLIRTGVFPAEFSRWIQALFKDRQAGDYDAVAAISSESAARHMENAKAILDAVREYCGGR